MSGTLSPDGKWLWNGTEWIPAPPTSDPHVVENAVETIRDVAKESGIPIQAITGVAQNYDLNNDLKLDRFEVEMAANALQNPPLTPYSPSFTKHQKPKNRKAAIGIVAMILLSSIFWLMSPDYSPISSIHDSDGDGYADSEDVFKNDPNEWADSDYDGVGDNTDVFPNDANETIDTDNDGVGDNSDRYPSDPTETKDSDNDGVGDNADAFPNDATETDDSDNDGFGDNKDVCPTITGSSFLDRFGCRDSDNDGVSDKNDKFPNNPSEWYDVDDDGYGDNSDACPTEYGLSSMDRSGCLDSDYDGYSDADLTWYISDGADAFPYEWSQWKDSDQDGYGDNVDGYLPDLFPFDPTEWADFDGDGTGDNADLDDDNDGVSDVLDTNDYADTGIILTFDSIRINEQMDYFDEYGEIYICLHWNYDYAETWVAMDYIYSCSPSGGYWSLEDFTTYDISDYSVFIDLPEIHDTHSFGVSVWDSDAWDDDPVDVNPSSDFNFYYFQISSEASEETSYYADGSGDGQGWDGEIGFSIQPTDIRHYGNRDFDWEYGGYTWTYSSDLSYSTYTYFRNLDHSVDYYDISTYARFSTPDEQYVIDLATDLEDIAIQNGYTTDLEIAEFIYAFVGAIDYQFDAEGMGENEYPKYPIEMLWHQAGDCEDAATLYISLVEAIGYDAMLMVGLVKSASDEDWGGHAWAVVHIPDHSGEGWYGSGSKSNTPFYWVEATGYYDGVSEIGQNPWYDVTDYSMYDVE